MKEICQISSCKNVIFDDLLQNQHLFSILHTSLIIKNSKNAVKSGYLEKSLGWTAPIFFKI